VKYSLIKLSSPGFDLNTSHIHIVRDVLGMYVCDFCKITTDGEYNEWPENYDDLPVYEQVHVLLSTSCGAEFMLEEDHVEGITVTHDTLF
jgi:hypothetical protein